MSGIFWEEADDIKKKVENLVERGKFYWINLENLFFVRSHGSKSRAIARIWGLPKLWQKVLKLPPCYIIEVVSERFDKMDEKRKDDVLLHEIAHIPRNFSGSLVPHFRRGKRNFQDLVNNLKLRYHWQDGNYHSSRRR